MSCTANQSSPIQIFSRDNLGTMFMSFELSKESGCSHCCRPAVTRWPNTLS